jgi:REP element-mobilizing transposase RayT
MGRLRPSFDFSATEKPKNLAIFIYLMSQILIFIVIRLKVQPLHVPQHMFIQVKPKANVSERMKLIGWFESCMWTDAQSCYYYEVPNTFSKPSWQEHYRNAI